MNVIVLAAGMSRRMGAPNKMLLPYQDSTIIEHTLTQITQFPFMRTVVVVGNDHALVSDKAHSFHTEVVYNPDYESGQVSSVKAGLKYIDSDVPFMVALGDMPLITTEMYRLLVDQFLSHNDKAPTIMRPRSKSGAQGNPVLFDLSFRQPLLDNDDLDSSKKVIRNHKESLVFFNTEEAAFFQDIDTPEDYEKLISSGL